MPQDVRPWRIKELTPIALRELLAARPTLIVPVGTTEPHGPHLPLGCDTIVLERLADDLSARFGVARAPTVEYGVHAALHLPGGASLRRKTLHRVMNELIESWEVGAGVQEFLILTAQTSEGHLEALSTIRTTAARVIVVDVFALDLGEHREAEVGPVHGGAIDTSLLLYVAPDLVRMDLARDYTLEPEIAERFKPGRSRLPHDSPGSLGLPSRATPEKGERLYSFILERVSRCLDRSEQA